MIGDFMYFYQAIQHVDSDKFVDAAVKEINNYVDNQCWEFGKVDDVPKDAEIYLQYGL